MHPAGPLERLGDCVGAMLLDREAESKHAWTVGTVKDASG
jgi:hypothetical protein